MVEITSEALCVQIDEEGAQLRSIKDKCDNTEYLWQRDPSIWSSSAPVVFPVIGKLNNLMYRFHNKQYHMKSNGIIRYETLSIAIRRENYVEFLFENKEDTLRQYPFPCRFKIGYEIIGSTLNVTAVICNDGVHTMYYNYAGHPGFNVPLYEGECGDDYYIEFAEPETMDIYDVCESGQLLNSTTSFFENEKRFFLRKNLFIKEALVFRHPKSKELFIKALTNKKEIHVRFEEFDNLAVWSPYHEDQPLSFICIEPWIGHTDFKDYDGDFSQRDEVASLEAGKQKRYQFSITFKS